MIDKAQIQICHKAVVAAFQLMLQD